MNNEQSAVQLWVASTTSNCNTSISDSVTNIGNYKLFIVTGYFASGSSGYPRSTMMYRHSTSVGCINMFTVFVNIASTTTPAYGYSRQLTIGTGGTFSATPSYRVTDSYNDINGGVEDSGAGINLMALYGIPNH